MGASSRTRAAGYVSVSSEIPLGLHGWQLRDEPLHFKGQIGICVQQIPRQAPCIGENCQGNDAARNGAALLNTVLPVISIPILAAYIGSSEPARIAFLRRKRIAYRTSRSSDGRRDAAHKGQHQGPGEAKCDQVP